ncbi:hypothetical protein Tco_0059919 [Tanacetum coccineum]
MLKSLLSNNEKLIELANTPVSENCSAVILKKLPEKLGDPGKFLIPCGFSELKCKALAESGSTTFSSPSLHIYETSDYSLEEFADELAHITFPLGNDDLPFDAESDLLELEYLLNHIDHSRYGSTSRRFVDENSLDEILDDTISEVFAMNTILVKSFHEK